MTSVSNTYPIRDAFQRFYPDYEKNHSLTEEQRTAATMISKCKTGQLGYNTSLCKDCGKLLIHAASCNNRYCPCCQAPLAGKWELERNTEMIEGIAYFHVVFTIPHELNPLIQANLKVMLDLFFKCVHDTLIALCSDKRFMGATPGIISVLHTWGQKVKDFHPHIHVCISGGGITPDGKFRETKHKGFFLPEETVAKSFRGRFLCALKQLYKKDRLDFSDLPELEQSQSFQSFIDSLFKKRWLPFIKETFNGRGNAIRYLARYSYRTAISNSRMINVSDDTVTIRYKDYADENRQKGLPMSGPEFIEAYLQHVMPAGFHRFRFAGYLANCKRKKCLKLIHKLRKTTYQGNPFRRMKMPELLLKLYGRDICRCPDCSGSLEPLGRASPDIMQTMLQESPIAFV